jgi:hypothetical protein
MEVPGGHAGEAPVAGSDPFALDGAAAYRAWREGKLAARPRRTDELLVAVGDLARPTRAEHAALLQRLRRANMALYQCDPDTPRAAVLAFAGRFGLATLDHNPAADDDGLSAIQVQATDQAGEFIPYTDRAIRWHTDGYYNPPARTIRAFLLHCVRPAATGGVNALLDPELLYLRLRDRDPALVTALVHPQAMTIPAHVEAGVVRRPEQAGPVFSVLRGGPRPALHLRYTARTRSIRWRDDAATRAAVAALAELLDEPVADAFVHRLEPGQGLLCNNVLHARSAFRDTGAGRLLYRARFHERVAGT